MAETSRIDRILYSKGPRDLPGFAIKARWDRTCSRQARNAPCKHKDPLENESFVGTLSNCRGRFTGIRRGAGYHGGDLLHTMGISGRSRVRTELLHFVVVPSTTPHPGQLSCQLADHGHFRDLAPAPRAR